MKKSDHKLFYAIALTIIIFALVPVVKMYYPPIRKLDAVVQSVLNGENSISHSIVREQSFEFKNSVTKIGYVEVDTSTDSIGITSPQIVEKKDSNTFYGGYTLDEYEKAGKYRVVQSGGYLSSWSPPTPLGYLKIQGKEYNRLHNSWLTKGVFCTDGRDFKIFPFENISQFDKWPSCIQAGPIMAAGSRAILDTARNTWYVTGEKHRQSFLCKNSKGNLIMGISEDINLADLTTIITRPIEKQGLGCVDAVALTGKGIAGILANSKQGPYLFGSSDVPLPNAIVVK